MLGETHIQKLFDLTSKVFFVAGGSRHLGRDMAEALAEANADGIITSRDAHAAHQTADALRAATGKRIYGIAMDATDEQSVTEAMHSCHQHFGRLDILVSNVGGGAPRREDERWSVENRELADWQALQAVNLTATFLLAKKAIPMMRTQSGGSIINIASVAGMLGRDRRVYVDGMRPQTLDYAVAKAGIIGLTRDLAAMVGRDGIRVNAISPGGFARGQPEGFIQRYSDKTILGRMGRDGVDLKGAALFLASDASAYVTGHNLVVDGGFTAWQ